MRTGLDTVKKALVGLVRALSRLRVSTAVVTTKQNRKRYQPVTYSRCARSLQLPVLNLFAVTGILQPELVAAIAPIIAIHSSITNYEPIIIEIPMTMSAAAVPDIPHTASARSTSVPASISGVVAVYKLAALIIWVAENSTAAMTLSPALAQSCCW